MKQTNLQYRDGKRAGLNCDNAMLTRKFVVPAAALVAVGLSLNPATASATTPPAINGALTTYYDSTRGYLHVIYQSTSGQLIDLYYASGWHQTVLLNPDTTGLFSNNLLSYYDGTNGHVFSVCPTANASNATLRICELWGAVNPTNMTEMTGTSPQGFMRLFETSPSSGTDYGPEGGSTLAGFWDGSVEHVFYESTDNTVHEHYHDGGGWHDKSLGGSPFGAEAGQNLAAVWDGRVEHVFYNTYPGTLTELYHNNNGWFSGGNWSTKCGFSRGPVFFMTAIWANSPLSVWGFDNTNGQVEVCSEYGGPTWSGSAYSVTNYDANSTMVGFLAAGAYEIVAYVGNNQQIYAISGGQSTPIISGSAPPIGGGNSGGEPYPIGGVWDGTWEHIFYVGTDEHIWELRTTAAGTSWSAFDILAQVGNSYPAAL